MKQSNYLLDSFTAVELEVAQIFLDLEELIVSSQWKPSFSWGGKRRRSSLDAPPQLLRTPPREVIEQRTPQIPPTADAEKNEDERATVSPDTPFSFSPSESDGVKSSSPLTTMKKTPKKRAKEVLSSRKEYVDSVDGLTRSRDLLWGELKNVKEYYEKLKAFHSQLKAIKVEALNSTTIHSTNGESSQCHQPHPKPLDGYRTVQNYQLHSSDNGLGFGSVHDRTPLLFDLNQPAEEESCPVPFQSHPLDEISAASYERARCAEARRKRRVLIKSKLSRSGTTVKVQKE